MKKTKTKQLITKEMSFTEILKKFPETTSVFFQSGMHCLGCGMAKIETLEQGCISHGIDPDVFVKELNKKIQKNQ